MTFLAKCLFEYKVIFFKLFSSLKVMVAIKDVNTNLISASRQNIKNLVGKFGAISTWKLCIPNFRPQASLVWEENEVTDRQT